MSTEITGGKHIATTYSGSGSGLVEVPLSSLASGNANHVVVNDGAGALNSMSILGAKQGGFTVDISTLSGLYVAEATNGVPQMSTYSTAASANTIVRKTNNGAACATLTASTLTINSTPTTGSVANIITSSAGGIGQRNLSASIGANLQTTSALTSAMTLVSWPNTQGNGFRLNNGLLEATTAGVYSITATVVHTASTTTYRNTRMDWTSAGVTLSPMQMSGGTITNSYPSTATIMWIGKLAAGDTIAIYTGGVTVASSTTTASRIVVTRLGN